jgi:hypothetical protein
LSGERIANLEKMSECPALTTTPVRDTSLLRIVNIASVTYFPPTEREGPHQPGQEGQERRKGLVEKLEVEDVTSVVQKQRRIITCRAACLITSEVTTCDGAVSGGRLELRPPVESSDLDEKV